MPETLLWWLALQLLALVSLVPAHLLFRSLPDRGYGLAKALGLLLPAYALWILAWTGFLPNGRPTLAFVVLLLGLAAVFLARRRGAMGSLTAFFHENWRHVLATEAVFAASFFAFALFRAYRPEIAGTEQPMDFAFLNAILRSDYFPPNDPWLSGYSISYYYFGYLIQTLPIQITGIPSSIGYNLALATIFALTMTGAFSLGYNLVAPRSRRAAPWVGVLAGLLLAVIGNLQGALELLRARGLGPPDFWQWIGVNGALTPYVSSSWLPSEHFWWWHATRVINTLRITTDPGGGILAVNDQLDYTITEFPFFSFLLGDMHPHVMALPFVLLALGLALSFLRRGDWLQIDWIRREPFAFAGAALILGALGFINSWDLPTYMVVALGALLLAAIRYGRVGWPFLALVGALAGASILLYLPFYVSPRPPTPGPGLVGAVGTRPVHFLIILGPFILALGCYLLARLPEVVKAGLITSDRSPTSDVDTYGLDVEKCSAGACPPPTQPQRGPSPRPTFMVSLCLGAALVPAALWALGQALAPRLLGQNALAGATVLGKELSVVPLVLTVASVLFLLIYRESMAACLTPPLAEENRGTPPDPRPISGPVPRSSFLVPEESFILLLVLAGFALTLGTELFFLRDAFGNRMNTMFKFYYQVWVLFAMSSAYGIYWVAARLKASKGWPWPGSLWGIGLTALLMAALAYPVAASFSRMNMFGGKPTLDGLAFVKGLDQAEYEAVQWLNRNIEGSPVIVETPGGSYTEYGRVSAWTGLPTVVQWPGHEMQWRGPIKELSEREQDVHQIYSSADAAQVQRLLDKYGARYVYVGRLERERYGESVLGKFATMMETAFQNQGVTIYRVRS